MGHAPVTGRAVPIFLIAACIIPATFGSFRIYQVLLDGPFVLKYLADQVDNPPLLLHMIGAIAFLILGAMQVLPGIRARNIGLHRRLGRVAAPMGIIGAVSGVWMTLLHPDISGPILYYGRLLSGTAWAVFILVSLRFVLRRDIKRHRNWMIRAYALALPAGTLAFFLLPVVLIIGEEGNERVLELIQVVAWPVHLAIAEWIIRRRPARAPSIMALPAQ